ncbi:MAG: hypothetical protein ISS74_11120 [Planctomycetes bacterium]|nr:hypothetical protein [Planctomycetota bacterium]
MDKPTKADMERQYVKKALACLRLSPVSVSTVERDPPDVRVELAGRVLGIEVMEYHRDLTEGSSELRQQEARTKEIEAAFDVARKRFPEVMAKGLVFLKKSKNPVGGVTPNWLRLLPKKMEAEAFAIQLLEFARSHARELTASRQVFDDFGDVSPLLKKYVQRMELRSYSWTPIWNFDPQAKMHGFPEEQWAAHIRHKAERISKARQGASGHLERYDEIWLVLACGQHSSQMVAATIDCFKEAALLDEELTASPFSTVLIYQCWEGMPLYKWRRGEGWSEVRNSR